MPSQTQEPDSQLGSRAGDHTRRCDDTDKITAAPDASSRPPSTLGVTSRKLAHRLTTPAA